MEKQTKKYNKTLVNKKREKLRRLCYDDETTDEVIMNIHLIGWF